MFYVMADFRWVPLHTNVHFVQIHGTAKKIAKPHNFIWLHVINMSTKSDFLEQLSLLARYLMACQLLGHFNYKLAAGNCTQITQTKPRRGRKLWITAEQTRKVVKKSQTEIGGNAARRASAQKGVQATETSQFIACYWLGKSNKTWTLMLEINKVATLQQQCEESSATALLLSDENTTLDFERELTYATVACLAWQHSLLEVKAWQQCLRWTHGQWQLCSHVTFFLLFFYF